MNSSPAVPATGTLSPVASPGKAGADSDQAQGNTLWQWSLGSAQDEYALEAAWYCVHTKPRRETHVAAYFEEVLGLEAYLPRLRQYRTVRRVRRLSVEPLFPRYIFCRFDAALQFRAVRHAPEVLDIVRFGDRPALVDEAIIRELKSWAGDAVDVIDAGENLNAGDRVTVTNGPLRGLQATILQARHDRDRVALLLSTLECQAQLLISRSLVARAV
jgi:transcriptional antiterminator RfaH